MKLTFLGTGGVQAAPLFGCCCAACLRARQQPARRRTPCSALIQAGNQTILLDAGQPLLEQRFRPGELSGILLTHFHMDHVQGLFALRWGVGPRIPVWAPPDDQGCDDLLRHPGILDFQPALTPCVAYPFGELRVTPLLLQHSKLTHGYLFDWYGMRLAWLCDTRGLPPATANFLRRVPLDHLVIDCNDAPGAEGRNHNDVTRALAIAAQLAPRQSWLTHLSHEVDCWLMTHALPARVAVAQDNQQLDLSS